MKQLVLLVVASVESSVYVRQHVGVNCNSQNRQKPRERSLVVLSPVCQQSSLWLPQSDLKVRANRISPLTDLRVLRLTEDIWESQQLGNGVSQAYSSKKKCFCGCRRRKWTCTHKNCGIFPFPAASEGSMAKVSWECHNGKQSYDGRLPIGGCDSSRERGFQLVAPEHYLILPEGGSRAPIAAEQLVEHWAHAHKHHCSLPWDVKTRPRPH